MYKKIILKLILLAFICSCSGPKTKAEYLKEYALFIQKVKVEFKTYTDSDWEKQLLENKKYTEVYYVEFFNEMSVAEKFRVSRFNFAFHFYKGDFSIRDLFSKENRKNFLEFTEELKLLKEEMIEGVSDFKEEDIDIIIDRLTD